MNGNSLLPKKITDLICPLCGINKAEHNGKKFIHQEHIPPRCVLDTSVQYTQSLIKVPSCWECNNGTAQYDEHFKYQLSLFVGSDNKSKQRLWESSLKTLNKKPAWKKQLIESISPIITRTPIGYCHSFNIESTAIVMVIRKMIRGLHWQFTGGLDGGEILPSEQSPSIKLLKQGERLEPYFVDLFAQYGKLLHRCGNAFEAVYAVAVDSPFASAWLIRFYGENFAIGFLSPNNSQGGIIPDNGNE